MPDRRAHRGAHPQDETSFGEAAWPALRQAASDLSWLLSHDYAAASSGKLVGDRYNLDARQRTAVARCSCSYRARASRRRRSVTLADIAGQPVWIDGYNVLTTVEAALAGGPILVARDGAVRDMASMHGTYRKVAETVPALELIGGQLAVLKIPSCIWLLDRPVSNSGRLRTLIRKTAEAHGWNWDVELVPDPDPLLAEANGPVATADSGILDRCDAWLNLARRIVDQDVPQPFLIDLS